VLTIAVAYSVPVDAEFFAAFVARASAGSIRLQVDNIAAPGDDDPNHSTRVIQYVAEGKADLGVVEASAFDVAGVTSFRGLLAPFLIDSYGLEDAVLRSSWAQALLGRTRAAGVVGVGYVNGIMQRPLGITRELLEPSDYAGQRIGILEGSVAEMSLRALGAIPVVYPPSNPHGLDGIAIALQDILIGGFQAQSRSLTGNVAFWPRIGVVVANADRFDRLSPEQQSMLRAAGRDNLEASIDGRASFLDQLAAEACDVGIVMRAAPDATRRALREAVQPVYEELGEDPQTRETIEAIEEVKVSLGLSPDALACSAPPASVPPLAPRIDSPIVGTWEASFTREEYRSSPFVRDYLELILDEWGDLVLTFQSDGRVSFERTNTLGSLLASGTYSVTGERIAIDWDSGDSPAFNGVKRTHLGRWSVFRDTLSFERLEGGELPAFYLVRAWSRAR
jgi:TRAP-type C4-dicarboxylate transport system substrate-binding protein